MSEGRCPNPLLLGWLEEWMNEAKERNSKGYKKAYQSMKACPTRFDHPSEAQVLSGLGPKLCDRLADKLKSFCDDNGLPMPQKGRSKSAKRTSEALDLEDGEETQPAQVSKKPRQQKQYVPKLRSGAYALVMALGQLDQAGTQALSKPDLIEKAQPFCDSSFTAPSDPTKFFTAWNSMKTLEQKEMICTKGHPTKRYYLSDEGWEVALRMRATIEGEKPTNRQARRTAAERAPESSSRPAGRPTQTLRAESLEIEELDALPSTQKHATSKDKASTDTWRQLFSMDGASSPPPAEIEHRREGTRQSALHGNNHIRNLRTEPIVLPAGSFDVQLVVDTREIRTTTDRDYISTELRKLGVVPVLRALPLGDVLWTAKVKPPHDEALVAANIGDDEEGNREIILEYVVERKRLDDLVYSIKDGRFHEQKFRLRKSGIKNVTYLVEDYSLSAERSDKYGEALESALSQMQVVNDYFVKQTSKLDETIQYLAQMTKSIEAKYAKSELHVLPSAQLESTNFLAMLESMREDHPHRVYGTTFSAFSAICDKSDSMTLRDVYLRMLMCIRGVTGDKAIEIQKNWATPIDLVEAYEAQPDAKAKATMISNRLGNTIPRRSVGKALSTKIAEAWA